MNKKMNNVNYIYFKHLFEKKKNTKQNKTKVF